jgi:hypothetical protein
MRFAIAVVLVMLAVPSALGASQRRAAVADFYALSVLPFVDGLFAETFVADAVARMLPQASHGEIAVIPRADVRRAEREIRWRDSDALRFARLSELARAAEADWLVVGWIERLDVDTHRVGIGFPHVSTRPLSGFATVRIQLFDTAQGRIAAEASGSAYSLGVTQLFIAEQALRDAAARALPGVLSRLLAP